MNTEQKELVKQLSDIQEQINKEKHQKRLKSAIALMKIKNSVVLDKSRLFYGVISSDKKLYYKVNLNYCDCVDFVLNVESNSYHQCKHMIALEKTLKLGKIPVMDLSKLLRGESL